MKKANDVDEYIANQQQEVRKLLKQLRSIVLKAAPNAEEVISYGMPGYRLNGMLVWFAASKNHIGFYPTASPVKFFRDELTAYKTSKGAIQFPLDKPFPIKLITKIVKFKIAENRRKAKIKKSNT